MVVFVWLPFAWKVCSPTALHLRKACLAGDQLCGFCHERAGSTLMDFRPVAISEALRSRSGQRPRHAWPLAEGHCSCTSRGRRFVMLARSADGLGRNGPKISARGGQAVVEIRFTQHLKIPCTWISENEERTRTGAGAFCWAQGLTNIGLVGFPSVGKSTLAWLQQLSLRLPIISTIVLNLSIVSPRSVSLSQLPRSTSLIRGASQGVGLGTQFLRHIERTRAILHVIDMSSEWRTWPLWKDL